MLDFKHFMWYNWEVKKTAAPEENKRDYLAEIDALKTTVAELQMLVQYYQTQLFMGKRRLFGSSSEKTSVDGQQLSLFGEAEAPAAPETQGEEIHYKRKKRKGKREEDLSALPVERIDYELDEAERACPQCGKTMKDIGVDVRREFTLIPAQVVVTEHAAHTYACSDCSKNGDSTPLVKAKAPVPLMGGSLASASLVAHIAIQKYENAMPLYRLEKGFAYDGVCISRQNMANWVIQCSELYLEAIYIRLKEQLLTESVLHADETTFQILKEPGRAPQSKSYEWIYRTSGCAKRKVVFYDYKETRKQEHPREFLKDFSGYLHTDGYQVYHNLPPGIVVVGCWAHVRRKWENLLKTIPKEKREGSNAARGVAYLNALFALEREFTELSPQKRYQARLEKSKPIQEAFFTWARGLGALPKSPIGEAVGYMVSQRKYLENIFLDGRLELSNNRAERSVKPFVLGRKNWLFSCVPAGARASSVLYSIIETAKENGLHPRRYLEYLFKMLPGSTMNDLENLLPWSSVLPEDCHMLSGESRQCGNK